MVGGRRVVRAAVRLRTGRSDGEAQRSLLRFDTVLSHLDGGVFSKKKGAIVPYVATPDEFADGSIEVEAGHVVVVSF